MRDDGVKYNPMATGTQILKVPKATRGGGVSIKGTPNALKILTEDKNNETVN